ncbi:MAG: amino acid carrier protein [Pseudomonadota bacterium]
MWQQFFKYIDIFDSVIWQYLAFSLIIAVGATLTRISRGYQFRVIANAKRTFRELKGYNNVSTGTNPIRLFFASIGGMIGLGNIATITAVVTIGGPGGIFWMWIAVAVGMLIKYADIYLGVTYRVKNAQGSYDGGPMYYLKAAFNNNYMPKLYCILLCVYGVEISQFVMLADTISANMALPKIAVVVALVVMILAVAVGGVKRLANICCLLMPPFVVIYIALSCYVLGSYSQELLGLLSVIFKSAFTGYAPIYGFGGSTILLAAHYGASKAVYSGDIGIGYDSIIHSETKASSAKKQAKLSILSLLTDCIICTLTCLLVLVSGYWFSVESIQPTEYIIRIFSHFFPYMQFFMTTLFFLASFTTILAFLVVGVKSAKFLNNAHGEKIYLVYATLTFLLFAFAEQEQMVSLMSLCAGLIMLITLPAIYKLRHKVKFREPK